MSTTTVLTQGELWHRHNTICIISTLYIRTRDAAPVMQCHHFTALALHLSITITVYATSHREKRSFNVVFTFFDISTSLNLPKEVKRKKTPKCK